MKKIICLILTLVLTLSCFCLPFGVNASGFETENGVKVEIAPFLYKSTKYQLEFSEEVDIDFNDGESSISSSEEEMVDSTSSAEKTGTINDNESNKEGNNRENKKTGNIVFVVITVVIVGIAAIAGFILYRKKIRK